MKEKEEGKESAQFWVIPCLENGDEYELGEQGEQNAYNLAQKILAKGFSYGDPVITFFPARRVMWVKVYEKVLY